MGKNRVCEHHREELLLKWVKVALSIVKIAVAIGYLYCKIHGLV